jgi:hypothetical protein
VLRGQLAHLSDVVGTLLLSDTRETEG